MRITQVDQRLTQLEMPPAPTTRKEFDRFMRKKIDRWAQVIRDTGIHKQ